MMRRFISVALVALAAGTSPAMLRAEDSNPNQQAAQKICSQLRDNGQLGGRKIGVRYLNGTVWLQGQVADRDHYNKVLEAVMATSNVTITRVIPDGLAIDGAATATTSQPASPSATAAENPLRGSTAAQSGDVIRAQPLPSTFSAGSPATLAAMMQAVPAPPAAPVPAAPATTTSPTRLPAADSPAGVPGPPLPMYAPGTAVGGPAPVRYDQPAMPAYAWPSYAAYPNYAAVTYPKQYSPTAWPYIGPFYPYPQVPLGWRKVNLQWDDGWWWLDFKDRCNCCWFR